jgi:anti-sigma factor RsiW
METNPFELVCREVVELVTEYLGGTLPPQDRERFEHHLSTCPPCTAYLAQVRATLDLAAELRSPGVPPAADVAQQLGDMFRRWHRDRKP